MTYTIARHTRQAGKARAGLPSVCWLGLALFFGAVTQPVVAAPAWTPDNPPPAALPQEIEMGGKAAVEVEKSPKIKLLDVAKDPQAKALTDKLNKMAAVLAAASTRPLIKYTIKVIDDKDMNAFTLPDGHIYVYKGLIDAVASDDEMAAVLAHEIGHNCRMHALRGEAKAKHLSWVNLAALVGMLAGGRSGGDMAVFSQYLLVGIMNGYSIDYEKEADAAGIKELMKTSYNPSAMVTLMQRFDQMEKRSPEIPLGIFQNHPTSAERTAAAMADIMDAGLTFSPRDVQGGPQATVAENTDRVAVKIDAVTIVEFALQPGQKPSAKERAQQVAQRLNDLLRENLMLHEVTVSGDATTAYLMARGNPIAQINPADAKLEDLTALACAQKWRDGFRRIFWRENLNGKL